MNFPLTHIPSVERKLGNSHAFQPWEDKYNLSECFFLKMKQCFFLKMKHVNDTTYLDMYILKQGRCHINDRMFLKEVTFE